MSVIGGFGGAVGSVDTVRDWSINSSAELAAYVASNTNKGKGRLDGNYDWSGSYNCYGHTPVNYPGTAVSITLTLDNVKGVSGDVVIAEVTIEWDVEGAGIIQHSTSFEGDGVITLGAQTGTDVTIPNPPSAAGCKLFTGTLADSPVYTEVSDIRVITLTITAATPSYSSSSTYAANHPRIKRIPGGVIDMSVSWSLYTEDPGNLLVPGDVHVIKIEAIPGGIFWDLRWVRIDEAGDFGADIEGSSLVTASQGGKLDGFNQTPTTKTGSIVDPSTANVWAG